MTEQIEGTPAYAPGGAAPSRVVHPVRVPDPAALRAERERLRGAREAYEAKLSRLRLYSYCLTLTACVLALLSFMYLTQGAADGDATFMGLGLGFVTATAATLWVAVRITHVAEFAVP